MVMARFCARLRKQEGLPPVSMKEVYQHPTISSLAASVSYVAPTTPTERLFCEALSGIMSIEQVSVDSHFFDDLGADSLDLVELIMSMEEEFEVDISDEDAEKIVTVQDAIDYIDKA